MRRVLFLLSSARENGNAEQLARLAAESLPAGTPQTWLRLRDFPLPPFEDIRHTTGVYPQPQGNEKTLLDATLTATDIVFVSPVYWYSVTADLKRYLDEWSSWLPVPEANFRERMRGNRYWTISNSTGTSEQAQPMFGTLRLCAAYFGADISGELLRNGSKPGEVLNDQAAVEAARSFFRS